MYCVFVRLLFTKDSVNKKACASSVRTHGHLKQALICLRLCVVLLPVQQVLEELHLGLDLQGEQQLLGLAFALVLHVLEVQQAQGQEQQQELGTDVLCALSMSRGSGPRHPARFPHPGARHGAAAPGEHHLGAML